MSSAISAQKQRIRPRRDADGMASPQHRGELALEALDFDAEDESLGITDAGDGGQDFILSGRHCADRSSSGTSSAPVASGGWARLYRLL
jgi:hypothetical protein